MENNRRYFIVHFTGQTRNKKGEYEQQRGKIHMFVEDDGYVNEKFIHDKVINEYGLESPYVERVEELDEDDFYDFINEHYPHDQPEQKKNKPREDNYEGLI